MPASHVEQSPLPGLGGGLKLTDCCPVVHRRALQSKAMASGTASPATDRDHASGPRDHTYEHRGTSFDALLVPKDRLLAVQEYDDVREDDVIVWTYPKAGTHWTADIVSKILFYGNLDKACQGSQFEVYYEISPPQNTVEQVAKKGLINGLASGTLQELSDLPSPRVIQTHLPHDMLPQKVQDGQAKVIYVYRDPRDMAVSMWHHLNTFLPHLKLPAEPWDTFLQLYTEGRVSWGLWSRHFKSCQTVKDKPHVLVIYYEQMLQDLKGTVRKISSFMGKELTEEATEAIAASSSFGVTKAAKPNSAFLRKGIAGDWKGQFTVAQSEQFNDHIVKEVADLQLSMPYGPF